MYDIIRGNWYHGRRILFKLYYQLFGLFISIIILLNK